MGTDAEVGQEIFPKNWGCPFGNGGKKGCLTYIPHFKKGLIC